MARNPWLHPAKLEGTKPTTRVPENALTNEDVVPACCADGSDELRAHVTDVKPVDEHGCPFLVGSKGNASRKPPF